MLTKNSKVNKALVIILIFTLTFSNFAFVTESLATSAFDMMFGTGADTGHKNVEFEAFFGTEDDKSYSVISDVNNNDLAIGFMLGVRKSGYLKDAKIEISEAEELKGLNYKIKEELELSETVQKLEDNILELKQINNSSEINMSIPIEYEREDYVNESKLKSDSKVTLSGIYVDEDGEEIEIFKEIILNVSWNDERKIEISSEVTKYIQYGMENAKGIILQTLVKLDGTIEGNSLPVKESKFLVNVPKVGNISPNTITVTPNSTEGTNGKSAEDVKFDENNWSFDEETDTLTVTANNEKELVKINQNENEYLKDLEEDIEEERYYSVSGVDEYLITYTYENIEILEEMNANYNISAQMTTLSGVEEAENINIVFTDKSFENVLTGETGDIVSYNIENGTDEVSKVYTYLNYNTANKHEIEYNSKNIVNISYKEIVEGITIEDVENVYVDKQGNAVTHNDMYYRQVSILKNNFFDILGEDGSVEIFDTDGKLLAKIDKEYELDENDNFVVNFNDKQTKLTLKTSAPVNEGNLVINNKKVTTDSSLNKETYSNLEYIGTNVKVTADYTYVGSLVEIGTKSLLTKLNDTNTKVNLVLDRDNLSTLADNEVELRIELNNDKVTSDIFGNSVFEIEMPEYVKNINITNVGLLYAEGLEVSNVEAFEKDGKILIRVTLNGKQEMLNSGVITNGTNIILNANVKVDLYTPAMEEEIKLNYYNKEATNYTNKAESGNGYETIKIRYSAPTGLVAVNSTSNYNNVGSVLTSVKQGAKEDIIDIYTEAKKATMEVIVMNNNYNTVSEVSILGRIPFKGVKDIASGNDLGTTIDTKMINGIIADERNRSVFEVYYSENGEATNDITKTSNGWTMNPESLQNIKSYLIVPINPDYEMAEAEILRFTYEYEIPENLTHNEEIYGTFLIYYTNNSDVATTEETSVPDLIGLTTGEGPEIELEINTNVNEVKEYEELKITAKVTNTGSSRTDEVKVNIPVPNNSTYLSVETEKEGVTADLVNNIVIFNIESLEVEESAIVTLNVTANKYPTLEEYYGNTEGFLRLEDDTYVIRTVIDGDEHNFKDEIITAVPEVTIDAIANATAKDLGKELSSDTKKVTIKKAEITILEEGKLVEIGNPEEYIHPVGSQTNFTIYVRNLTEKSMNDVIITKILPKEFKFIEAYTIAYKEDGLTQTKLQNVSYDENTRTISWNIGALEKSKSVQVQVDVEINDLEGGMTKSTVYTSSSVSVNGNENYESNTVRTFVGKPSLIVSQTSRTNTYVTEGTLINYTFSVKNEGSVPAEKVVLTDRIPEGLSIKAITYSVDGVKTTKNSTSTTNATISSRVPAGQELVVNIEAFAKSLKGVQELSVTNSGTLVANNVSEMTTNSVTHIIEAKPNSIANKQVESSSGTGTYNNNSSNSSIVKTYKLTGTAWLDENKNGMREENEQIMSGITARLVNSETGVILKSITTDSNGEYNFSGIENGNYLVIFEYDTIKYTVTSYRKEGVESNVNSDAITTKIEQNGKQKNGAVTDVITINDSSISNIDIGLVDADKFDLALDKTISKVTTQNRAGTVTNTYDNIKLAKTEIGAKYLSGSTVYVEYTMLVSNHGDIAGYASKIIDYLPEGMTFNSGLNSDWYTGTDGNLYTTALSEVEIKPGETRNIKLVLTRQMTEENTGLVNNLAEIYEDYNIYGVSDTNSTPANKAQGENDIGGADTIISVKTGEVFIYISVIITSIILGSIVIFVAYSRIVIRSKKGGV